MRLFSKLLVMLLLFSVITIAAMLAVVLPLGNRTTQIVAANHLSTIADLQVNRLVDARAHSLNALALLSSRTQLRLSLAEFQQGGDLAAQEKMVRILMDAHEVVPGLIRIEVLGPSGHVVATTEKGRMGQSAYPPAFYQQAQQRESADVFVQLPNQQTALRSAGPLSLEGKVIGVIVADSDLTQLAKTIGNHSALGETGETLLARRLDGRMQLMFPNRFPAQGLPDAEKTLLAMALPGQANGPEREVVDYRNRPVLAVGRSLPDAGWELVVKQDLEEILAPGRSMRDLTLGFGLGLAVLAVLTGLWTSRQLTRPARQLAQASRRISAGDLEARCDISERKDEFGDMAECFNDMADKLVANHHELEHQVEARTKELHRVNEDLARSNGDLEQFAFIASHDLQAPIRNVATAVSLFRRETGDSHNEKAERYLQAMTESCTRMQDLVRGLLAFSRVNTRGGDTGQEIDTQALVDCAVEDLAPVIQECNATVIVNDLPAMRGDRVQIRQLFANLIGNALKYRDEHRKPEIQIHGMAENGKCRFVVEDNGIGIKPEYRERIFEIFKRLHGDQKYQGTGLGLSLVQKIVHRHGGTIWVEGEFGAGSRFCFTLPSLRDGSQGDDHAAAEIPGQGDENDDES